MGGPTPTPGGLCEGHGIRGRGSEAKVVVEAENNQGYTLKHLVGDITGGVGGSISGQGVKGQATEYQQKPGNDQVDR